MNQIYVLEPYEGERHQQVHFNDIPTLLNYLDHLFQKEDGKEIVEGYSILFANIFNYDDSHEFIDNDEPSCVPALSYYYANRKIFKCLDCKKDSDLTLSYRELDGKEHKICLRCGSSKLKRRR